MSSLVVAITIVQWIPGHVPRRSKRFTSQQLHLKQMPAETQQKAQEDQ